MPAQAVSGRLRVLPRSFTGVQTFRVGSFVATLARPVVSKAPDAPPPDLPPLDPGMPPPALPLDDDSVKGFGQQVPPISVQPDAQLWTWISSSISLAG